MRGLKIAFVVVIAVAAARCARFAPKGAPPAPQNRPITVVLVMKGSTGPCEAKFGRKPQHAFAGDTIDWEFVNTCAANKSVTLTPKNGSGNPFTTNAPWNKTVSQDNSGNPDVLSLVVDQNARGSYRFDITVDGVKYDPQLEIDPYQ